MHYIGLNKIDPVRAMVVGHQWALGNGQQRIDLYDRQPLQQGEATTAAESEVERKRHTMYKDEIKRGGRVEIELRIDL